MDSCSSLFVFKGRLVFITREEGKERKLGKQRKRKGREGGRKREGKGREGRKEGTLTNVFE